MVKNDAEWLTCGPQESGGFIPLISPYRNSVGLSRALTLLTCQFILQLASCIVSGGHINYIID